MHQCRICFRSVQSKGSLNRHYRQTHGLSFEDIQKLYNKLQQQQQPKQQEQQNQNLFGLFTAINGNDAAHSVTNLFSSSSNTNKDLAIQNDNQTVTYNPLCMQLAAEQENVFIIDEYLDDSVDFKDLNEF